MCYKIKNNHKNKIFIFYFLLLVVENMIYIYSSLSCFSDFVRNVLEIILKKKIADLFNEYYTIYFINYSQKLFFQQ